jgi:hypothetical protein
LSTVLSTHTFQGVLAGYDQKSNVVLSDSKERIYSMDEGVEEIPLGLYLVKGDMMCVHHRPVQTRVLTTFPALIASLSARLTKNTTARSTFLPFARILSHPSATKFHTRWNRDDKQRGIPAPHFLILTWQRTSKDTTQIKITPRCEEQRYLLSKFLALGIHTSTSPDAVLHPSFCKLIYSHVSTEGRIMAEHSAPAKYAIMIR